MTGTFRGRLSISQLSDEPIGDVVNAIAVNVHSNHLLHMPMNISSDSDNNSDLITSFMKALTYQKSILLMHPLK